MTFLLSDVREPFLTKNNVMWQYLEPELQKRIQDIEVDDSFCLIFKSENISNITGLLK